MSRKAQIDDEAILWAIRLRDAKPEEWEEFTLWLEADSSHQQAYREVALANQELGDLPRRKLKLADPLADKKVSDAPRRSRVIFGSGVAALLVASVAYLSVPSHPAERAIETEAGERRSIQLADGSRIDVNGSTRLTVGSDGRSAELESGEALFTIASDSADPFRVEAGDMRIEVIGTVFNVINEGRQRVSVAEGAVRVESGAATIRLAAGMAYRHGDDNPVGGVDTVSIGGWRQGQLSYSSASVAEVAADLSRNLGIKVLASPDVASKSFSGIIVVSPDRDRLFRRVSALLEVEARRSDEGWVLLAENR